MGAPPVPAPEPQEQVAKSGGATLRWPPVTLLICTVCLLLFAGIAASVPVPSWDVLGRWGYPSAERVWDGAYWRLLSSTVVHLALWHVAFNVYWLWQLGGAVERTLGSMKYVAFLLGAGAVSSAVQLGASGTTGHGASGLVYAMFGLMWVGRHTATNFAVALGDKTAPLFWTWLVGCIVAAQVAEVQIGNAAHVSGLLFGALVGQWVVLVKYRLLARWATVALVLGSLVPLFWSPWSPTWVGYRAYKAHAAGQYDAAIAGYRRSMALGGDRVWALQNLALAYHSKGSKPEYSTTLVELRAANNDAARVVEQEVQEANRERPKGTDSENTTSLNNEERTKPAQATEPRR